MKSSGNTSMDGNSVSCATPGGAMVGKHLGATQAARSSAMVKHVGGEHMKARQPGGSGKANLPRGQSFNGPMSTPGKGVKPLS